MSPAESVPVSRRWRSAVRVNLDVVTNRVAPADGRREGVAASDDRVSPCAITTTNVAQRQVTVRPAGHDGCGIAHEIEGLHLTHPSRAIRAYTAATNHSASRERRQRKTGWYPSLEQRGRREEVAHMSPLGVTVPIPYNQTKWVGALATTWLGGVSG